MRADWLPTRTTRLGHVWHTCPECNGYGEYTCGDSMDPHARMIECDDCEGWGEIEIEEVEAFQPQQKAA